jgi:hypothetical protein
LPYGCIEHQEKERAFEPKQFAWKESPEPGIYCSAIPTKLGESNVNGRMQTSFSPCFRHDARFSTAKCTDCDKGATECECDGVLAFQDGVRGSESNPAHIVGVFEKSVGSLTNWPAFKDILPVTAKEPDAITRASGNSAGVKKSWETRKGGVNLKDDKLVAEHLKDRTQWSNAHGAMTHGTSEWHATGASTDAHQASAQAYSTGEISDHRKAAELHGMAADKHYLSAMESFDKGHHGGAFAHRNDWLKHSDHQIKHHDLVLNDTIDKFRASRKEAAATEPVKPTLETIYAKHAGEVVKAGAPVGNKNAAGKGKLHIYPDDTEGRQNRKWIVGSSEGETTHSIHDTVEEAIKAGKKLAIKKSHSLHLMDEHGNKSLVEANEPTVRIRTLEKPSLETIFAKRPKLTLETIYARGVNGQPAGRN